MNAELEKVLARIDADTKVISSRDLNPRQRRKVRSIVRWYRERNAYNGVTSIRFILTDYNGTTWIRLKTRRSDCGKYSPRALVCEEYLHARIGPRGGVRVYTARSGLTSELTRVQKRL